MKRANKVAIIILIILITATGCKNMDLENKEDPNIDEDGQTNGEDVNVTEEQKVMNKFLDMINPETTADDLGAYIRENISYVNEKHAEEMIQWLTIYQTEAINEFNEKISEPSYLDVLIEDMEWVLDESKIENIENKEVKQDYQNLIDGYLTIVRYQETPVVETDWKALSKLSDYVSDDVGEVLVLYQKIQNYEYERAKLDVKGIMEDMIKTESILEKHKSGFINTMANKIYNLQTYSLLVGSEGINLELFFGKNGKAYEEISRKKDENPNTLTGKMIDDLEKRDYKEVWEVYDAIVENLKFGITSNNYITNKEFKKDNKEYKIFQIVMKDNEEKQNRINDIIEKDTDDYISKLEDKDELIISVYSDFQGDQYLSYNVFVNYPYYENQENLSLYRTFDYVNEKYIELEDYLGIDFNELKDYLKSIKGIEINSSPEFQLSDRGIVLIIEGAEGIEKYIQLSKKDLVPYLKLEQLINK